jgi:hypothetical protein
MVFLERLMQWFGRSPQFILKTNDRKYTKHQTSGCLQMNNTQGALQNPPPLASQQSNDPFSFGAASEVPASLPQDSFPAEGLANQQKYVYAGMVALALALLFGFYQIFVNDYNPIDGFLNLLSPDEEEPPTIVTDPQPAPVEAPPEEDPIEVPVQGNPYWILPNINLTQSAGNVGPAWTLDQEALIREGLSHTFVYQHYKSVQDIRRVRWAGSESSLKQALTAKKFWTRMFAAIGLAERSFSVLLSDLDKSLEGERSELIAGFFERFVQKPNAGQSYIFRQIVRLVDARCRMILIEGIAKSKDELSFLYLYAASQDPNPKVQAKGMKYLKKYQVSAQQQSLAEQMLQGKISAKSYLKEINLKAAVRYPNDEVVPLKTKDLGGNMVTESDIEQQMSDFKNDPGDIEFFNADNSDVFEVKDSKNQNNSQNTTDSNK